MLNLGPRASRPQRLGRVSCVPIRDVSGFVLVAAPGTGAVRGAVQKGGGFCWSCLAAR